MPLECFPNLYRCSAAPSSPFSNIKSVWDSTYFFYCSVLSNMSFQVLFFFFFLRSFLKARMNQLHGSRAPSFVVFTKWLKQHQVLLLEMGCLGFPFLFLPRSREANYSREMKYRPLVCVWYCPQAKDVFHIFKIFFKKRKKGGRRGRGRKKKRQEGGWVNRN